MDGCGFKEKRLMGLHLGEPLVTDPVSQVKKALVSLEMHFNEAAVKHLVAAISRTLERVDRRRTDPR
jgi:tmRNA-binding protein